jgi:hypothetical protein
MVILFALKQEAPGRAQPDTPSAGSPNSQEYLSLLARLGGIEAIKNRKELLHNPAGIKGLSRLTLTLSPLYYPYIQHSLGGTGKYSPEIPHRHNFAIIFTPIR